MHGTPSPADIIASARFAIYEKHPYLSHILFAMQPYEAVGLGTLAVDKEWRLLYDPETTQQWHQEMIDSKIGKVAGQRKAVNHDGIPAVIFHELQHCLRGHAERMRVLAEQDPEGVNIAFDREVNDDVEEAGWTLPGHPVMPEDIKMARGLTAEEYYRADQGKGKARSKIVYLVLPGSGGQACGSCAGNPTQWEKENSGNTSGRSSRAPGEKEGPGGETPSHLSDIPGVDKVSQEIAIRRTALAIQEHVKAYGRGTVPSGLQAWAELKLTPPKVDWRKKLSQMTRAALASIAGATDFTWRRPGRRSLYSAGRSGWPISPSLHQPVPKVGVVLDTSGSMQAEHEGRTVEEEALSEVVGIAQASGAGVKVYACDADVHACARILGKTDLQKVNFGGGGTDMRPGYAAARKDRPDFICIITDGIVGDGWPSPQDCLGVRTLAVLVGECAKPPAHIPFVEAV